MHVTTDEVPVGFGSEEQKKEGESNESGGGFMDKINTMAGGGKASEKDEDALDKGKHPPPKAVPAHRGTLVLT